MRVSKQSLHHPSRAAAVPAMRLPVWQRRSFYGMCIALFGSGLAWLAAHFFLRPVTEFGAAIHPLEPWSMKLHGGVAMLILWLLGSMFHLHIRRGLTQRRNLSAGWVMIGAMILLTATGYALYYIAGEESRPLWSVAHWSIGLLLPVVVLVHVVSGRRALRR